MPTDKPRITFALDQDMLDAIEDYKFRNRVKNQSQAIISLIEKGLNRIQGEPVENEKSPTPEGAEDEDRIVDEFESDLRRVLNKHGLLIGDDLCDADSDFLSHIISIVDAYFKKGI